MYECIYETLNLSSDGLQRLRTSGRLLPDQNNIIVERLITSYVDGVLLQMLSEFTYDLMYMVYYEPVFRIPSKGALRKITLYTASQLQVLTVVTPNYQLETLELKQTQLKRLPESLLNLRRLINLKINEGVLETFSLDTLINSPNISKVTVNSNKINQLVASNNSVPVFPIEELWLADNQLQYVDVEFFKPLTKLEVLNLADNKIQRIIGQIFLIPNMKFIYLDHNQLRTLNVTRWRAPKLFNIFLDYNNLTRIPVGLERLPKLASLSMANNQLTSIDLRLFEGCEQLQRIDLADNLLQNVLVSQAGRISLPKLTAIVLENNRLSRLNATKWNFPLLDVLTISNNYMQQLPNLFQYLPKHSWVAAYRNPLLCSTVRQWQQYVAEGKLQIDTTAYGMPCETNSTFTLPSGRVLCCVE